MKVSIVTVSLMISETEMGNVADAVSEILSSQMKKYNENSSLIDWQYIDSTPKIVDISDDYVPDEDCWPVI